MTKTMSWLGCWLFFAALPARASETEPLVVHEWGTFTFLQDEAGRSIPGINSDDEPVPPFVHVLNEALLQRNTMASSVGKGISICHPDVTMRLETPVIYFHPPAGAVIPPFDVHVSFHGGWLTEFYPQAESKAPGYDPSTIGHLTRETVGELLWKGVTLGGPASGPETDWPVWLAPRAVRAANVHTPGGEGEKFLFYRGVGSEEPLLRVVRDASGGTLQIVDGWTKLAMLDPEENLRVPAAWLVSVRPGGSCAFKSLETLEFQPQGLPRATVPAAFADSDFAPGNLERLKGGMRGKLIEAGLFADEADALLNTWQASYFKSPGLRLFYLCPRIEVEGTLPLSLSIPAKITRVKIGRIEIVTPGDRALLRTIAKGGDTSSAFDGAYDRLGRFRNALLLDEERRRPTPALGQLITQRGLNAFQSPR